MGYDSVKKAFETSISELQTTYLDLYLIHWPGISGLPLSAPDHARARKASWMALEDLYREGKCKAIGVSNFTIHHLIELLGYASVIPAVNQVEFHPKLYQKKLLDYCEEKTIKITAYSPLGRQTLIDDPLVKEIAKRHARSPAQILLRWGIQHNLIEIPKTSSIERLEENSRIFDFELSEADMKLLNSMHDNTHYNWDPTSVK